jgi:hypothetical protein
MTLYAVVLASILTFMLWATGSYPGGKSKVPKTLWLGSEITPAAQRVIDQIRADMRVLDEHTARVGNTLANRFMKEQTLINENTRLKLALQSVATDARMESQDHHHPANTVAAFRGIYQTAEKALSKP